MPKIPIFEPVHPNRDDQSLMVDSAARQLDKMNRELARFTQAHTEDHWTVGSDHGINFAISAWQMRDWLWAERHRVDADRFRRVMGVSHECSEKEMVRQLYVACPELRVCRLIATAAKHVTVKAGDPNVKIYRRWRPGPQNAVWIVETTEQCRQAVELFRVVCDFWERCLSSMFLIEDRFVNSTEPDQFDSF